MQWEVSQAIDECRPVAEDIHAHLQSCAECSQFARLWSDGTGPVATMTLAPRSDPALTERVARNVIETQVEAVAPAKPAWRQLSRWVAVVAFVGIAWWMLDPRPDRPGQQNRVASVPVATQALDRQMKRLEQPMLAEKEALHLATLDGMARVQEVMNWSLTALE